MQTITVEKRFVLTLKGGQTRTFEPGQHEVEDDIASHWFVQGHSKAVAPAEPPAVPAVHKQPPPAPEAKGRARGAATAVPEPEPDATPPKIPVPPIKNK
jgi:hypothetical protein